MITPAPQARGEHEGDQQAPRRVAFIAEQSRYEAHFVILRHSYSGYISPREHGMLVEVVVTT